MRIPVSKAYRAFPLLDEYSDAECKRYLKQAKSRGRIVRTLVALVALAVGVGLSVLYAIAVAWLARLSNRDAFFFENGFGIFLTWLSLVIGAVIPCVTVAIAVDYMILRNLRGRLQSTDCPGCGYALLGQRPFVDEVLGREFVRCPECGSRVAIGDGGIPRHNLMDAGPAAQGLSTGDTSTPQVLVERPLVERYPQLRGYPVASIDAVIAAVQADQPRRQRIAVASGVVLSVAIVLTLVSLVLWSPLNVLQYVGTYTHEPAVNAIVWILAILISWPFGVWTKRITRSMLERSAVTTQIDRCDSAA